jgi:fructose-bisphosphate aldolase, class II
VQPDILVEGEIGDIGSGSEIHDTVPDLQKGLTSPAQAKEFVKETRVDTLAPAVGNMHGMLKSMVARSAKKRLDIERIRAIKAETRIFMTLHGASATADEDLREAIRAGMTVVHINTEVRLAWRRGWDEALAKHPDEIVPYKSNTDCMASPRSSVLRTASAPRKKTGTHNAKKGACISPSRSRGRST